MAPTIGIVVMVGIVVALGVVVLVFTTAITPPVDPPQATIEGSFDSDDRELTLRHAGGDPLTIATIDLSIQVNGTSLEHQPPIPFFAATGFVGGTSGPFNPQSDGEWAAGETATLRIASTNDPVPSADSTVTVLIHSDARPVEELVARQQ